MLKSCFGIADDRLPFLITFADGLEEEAGIHLFEREIADFVDDEQLGPGILDSRERRFSAKNLLNISDIASGRTQSYTYDQLDRLNTMNDTGSTANACIANLPSIQ